MERKTIQVKKHPYMWNVEVEFGTFEQMIANRYRWQEWNGFQIFIGGTFNEKMNNGTRASLIELAVEIDAESFSHVNGELSFSGISSAKGIRYSRWEGTYCYYESLFDEMMKKGLFPIRADWDERTYIERLSYKGKDKNGVPIPNKVYYELTKHFVY